MRKWAHRDRCITDESDDWPRALSMASLSTPLPDPTGEFSELASIPETVTKLNEKDVYQPEPGEAEIDMNPAGIMLECQRRSKISPPGRSKTSPLNVMRYAVLGGCPGSP